jgi:phage shock protein E
MTRLSIVVALMFAAACSSGAGQAPSISPAELQAQRESGSAPVVIDVRSVQEYAAGHIPGAVHIPHEQVAERIGEVDTANGVALYCMIGPRARLGEAALLEAGQAEVFHIEGGFSAWQAAGLPVATD